MKRKVVWASLCLIVVAAMPFDTARATTVDVNSTITFVTVSNDVSPFPDGRTAVRFHEKGIIRTSDANSPFNLSSQDCLGTLVVAKDGGRPEGAGSCDAVDKDGDIWWLWWSDGPAGSPWEVIRGTGKYEGMTGGGTTVTDVQFPDGRLSITVRGTVNMK